MEPPPLTLDILRSALDAGAAAWRCRRRLQPGGGAGDKVFPPTYAGSVYAVEYRRVPGAEEPVTCVLLDSVQSQANRMEEALQDAVDAGQLRIPVVVVDFSGIDLPSPVSRITSLQAPHRMADAILRDSEFEGVRFRDSTVARRLNRASTRDAAPLLELCPTALLFGMWDSTGPQGGLGPRFERAIVSEIVGMGASISESHRQRGVRTDPLGASKSVPLVRERHGRWRVAETAKTRSTIRPAEVNHGNVPFESGNAGVTMEFAEQTTTLSLIALRRLRFPGPGGEPTTDRDGAARTLLAALGLCAATLAFSSGLDLRSRCLLWPDSTMAWSLLSRPGEPEPTYELAPATGLALLAAAIQEARGAGLAWRDEPLVLKPSTALVELVRRSQEQATSGPEDPEPD